MVSISASMIKSQADEFQTSKLHKKIGPSESIDYVSGTSIRAQRTVASVPCFPCTVKGTTCFVAASSMRCAPCVEMGKTYSYCGVNSTDFIRLPKLEVDDTAPLKKAPSIRIPRKRRVISGSPRSSSPVLDPMPPARKKWVISHSFCKVQTNISPNNRSQTSTSILPDQPESSSAPPHNPAHPPQPPLSIPYWWSPYGPPIGPIMQAQQPSQGAPSGMMELLKISRDLATLEAENRRLSARIDQLEETVIRLRNWRPPPPMTGYF